LSIHARADELCDLLIERVQTRFHGSNRLEQSHQGWTTWPRPDRDRPSSQRREF
jgi:hypothetical protein